MPGEKWRVDDQLNSNNQIPDSKQNPITQFSNGLKRFPVFFGNFGHWNLVII
jgi:hypothetical protein